MRLISPPLSNRTWKISSLTNRAVTPAAQPTCNMQVVNLTVQMVAIQPGNNASSKPCSLEGVSLLQTRAHDDIIAFSSCALVADVCHGLLQLVSGKLSYESVTATAIMAV